MVNMAADCEEVALGEECLVECLARDRDGDELSYNWSASKGEIVGDGHIVHWRAPDVEGLFRIAVAVSDGNGGVTTGSVMVAVRENVPPLLRSLTADVGWVNPGESCRIECQAEDPEGGQLEYHWIANGGTVFDRGRVATWVAPQAAGVYEIGVVVRDEEGAAATRVLPISVTLPGAPVIQGFVVTPLGHNLLRQRDSSYRVFRQRDYSIECLVEAETQLSYDWEAAQGVLSGSGPVVDWEAPAGRREVVVRVVVSDSWGRVVTGSVVFEVETCLCMFD
jgi:hypothetical protein